MNARPRGELAQGADPRETYRGEIARLPLTMRPALNQQVNAWDDLFPFEQKRAAEFLRGVSLFEAGELGTLTQALRDVEARMGVAQGNFSITADTMTNAAQLARSPYYGEWRREVQRVFAAIESRARSLVVADPPAARLIFLILPESLPVGSIAGQKPWDMRGVEYPIDGDAHRISEIALRQPSGLSGWLAGGESGGVEDESADCWMMDADAGLRDLAGQSRAASVLEYRVLKEFRDQFLAQVNTVPKDIEATDRILAGMRAQNWDPWWPASLRGQNRLRSFVIEVFLSGNGALIFSNAFVQWACSEAWRRARPRFMVGRFGLRPKPKPFTGIAIFENQQKISAMHDVDDPEGSAMDALILARYVWLSALRYPEHEQTSCVCVSESSRRAYLIAPDAKRPQWPSGRAVTAEEICDWMRRCVV